LEQIQISFSRKKILVSISLLDLGDLESRLLNIPGICQELPRLTIAALRYANDMAQRVELFSPHESPKEEQAIIAIALLVRMLETVESILILSIYGARQELESLFRIFLDVYFLVANVTRDANFVGIYLRTDEKERLKLMNSSEKHENELFNQLKAYATDDIRNALKQRIKDEEIKDFNSWEYANNVGCGVLYDSVYRIKSSAVHTGARCLEDYLDVDENGDLTHIRRRPNDDVVNSNIPAMIDSLLRVLGGICDVTGEDKTKYEALAADIDTAMQTHAHNA